MSKPFKKMLLFVALFFGLIFGWYGVKKIMFYWFISHYQPPPVTISSTKASSKSWQPYLTTVGTLIAKQGVEISPEVSGIIEEIRFHSGEVIKEGEVLLVLRNEIEQATLKSNFAKLQLAELNYDREKTLFNKKVSAQSSLQARATELSQAQASVNVSRAQIKQKIITAPFAGKLGIRLVNTGQFIAPGTPIVTLQALNPLYVLFNLPEQYISDLKLDQKIEVTLASGKIVSGKIKAINAKVDAATRNILVEAEINNDDLTLYPGMYGSVMVWLKEPREIIVVPQTAVSFSLSGDYVFIIKDESKKSGESVLHAYRQYVTTGEHRGDDVAILEGLNTGQEIVTAGQLKLQNGSRVLINNDIKL